jgi:hypothetical protein
MVGPLQVAAVVPSKILVTGDKRRHCLNPFRAYQGSQPAGHCFFRLSKSITPLQGITSVARGPGFLSQDGPYFAFSRW